MIDLLHRIMEMKPCIISLRILSLMLMSEAAVLIILKPRLLTKQLRIQVKRA